jgi:hypothetical protein
MKMLVAALVVCLCAGFTQSPSSKKEAAMSHAKGTFEVKLTPQKDDNSDPTMGRMAGDKQYHGDLEGTASVQMLFAGNPGAKGSGGYVAIEKVTGTLQGRTGTFVLQHSGTMNKGEQHLTITVVPDSGTGQLTGISGKMEIKIAEGKHFYEFEYMME